MTTIVVPPLDEQPWPTLGPAVVDFLQERAVFGPGSLKGQPLVLDPEKKAILYRAYEVYPQGHPYAGRRRFRRVAVSLRKGTAKTEFQALIAYAEVHPEGPVRCDGFDAAGNPVGRPVRDPYVPLLAYTEEQVEELAYGALKVIVEEGPDAYLFDSGRDRILRLDARGRADGKVVPLAGSPNARDGARTTHQGFDESHRLWLPKQLEAYETMMANLDKRPLDDPWQLEVTTAGQLGQGSIAEKTHSEALSIQRGEIDEPDLFYLHREAGPGHDLSTVEGRVLAITEATGPVGEYGPGQFRGIARQWDRPGADKQYLERVWLNRWVRQSSQAFDLELWSRREVIEPIPAGAQVVAGFDGARMRDATGIVITDTATGRQQLWAGWERPTDLHPDAQWEIDESEVTESWEELQERYRLVRAYCDPPHWTETVGSWEARWPELFEEWWTNRRRPVAEALRAYLEGIATGACTHVKSADFDRHVGNAGRNDYNLYDDQGIRLFGLTKIHPERKFDFAMAGLLSWRCYLDAVKNGWAAAEEMFVPVRVR